MKMTNLKCPACGGKLKPMENNPKIVVCEYCDSQFMVEEDQAINYHVHQYQPALPAGTAPQASRNREAVSPALVGGLLVAGLAIVIGGGIFAGSGKSSGTKTARETTVIWSDADSSGKGIDGYEAEGEDGEAVGSSPVSSPLYEAMVEAMFGKSAERISAEELQRVKYLKLTSGHDTCTLEYSFQAPYGEENFAPEKVTLEALEWDGDSLGFFTGLEKLDISDTWRFGSLKGLTGLKGLICSGLTIEEAAAMVPDPKQLVELGMEDLESLEGIAVFENLEKLSLEDVVSPDFKQLVPLKQLKALCVSERDSSSALDSKAAASLTDYGALSVLGGLESLEVESKLVRDISFVKSLSGLIHLALIDTDAISLEPLGELTGLTSLTLEDNRTARDYEPVKQLTGLTTLTLNKDTSQEDPDLSVLTNLETLDMSGFMSVSFLRNMGNLKNLSLHGCNIDEVSALSGLTGVEHLSLYAAWTYAVPLEDVSFIDHMPNLKTLDFSGISRDAGWGGYQRNTEILGDISNVFNHQGLEELYLNNCMFEIRFDRLSDNPSLKVLEMREVSLKENFYVQTSAGMTDIWYDDVSLDAHTDFLTHYPSLQRLYLDGNQLTDIRFAASLPELTHLGLNDNYITELSPLNQALKLEYLDIRTNPITSSIEVDEKVQILK